jgi:Leucine-rich repeat (LRR) protein
MSEHLKALKYLNISQTQLASIYSILYLLNTHGNTLVQLKMRQAILLGERDWITVLEAVTDTKIEKVDLSYNCLLTDYALEKLNIKSRKLELNVKYCDQLSIKAVSCAVERSDNNLIIHHNARIPDYTPEGIQSYIQYLVGQ